MLQRWRLVDTNFDGEPRTAAWFPEECRQCLDLEDCSGKVKFAYILDQFTVALSLEN